MIKNNKNSPFIQLPLIIGAEQVSLKHKKILINSLDYNINLSLKNDKALQTFINHHNQKQQRHELNYKILNNKEVLISTKQSQDLLSFHQQAQTQNPRFYIYRNNQQQFQNQEYSSNLLPEYKNSNNKSRHNRSGEFKFSYMVRLNKNINNSRIKIQVIQENIQFELTKISSNVKFVKNSILDNLFKNQIIEQNGLLSMDKQNRMLIESCKMSYPVIGFWVKSSKDIQSAQNYQYFSQFIKQKYQRKCLFKDKNQKKYFYFVNLCYQTKAIDVYLISWHQNQHLFRFADFCAKQKMIKLSHKQLKQLEITQKNPHCDNHQKYTSSDNNSNKSNIKPFVILKQNKQQRQRPSSSLNDYTFEIQSQNKSKSSAQKSDQQRRLEFTIRREDKKYELSTLQSLINYSYLSPIKQLQNDHNQQIGPFFLNSQQKSPQFSTCTKNNNFQFQCIDLRLQVKDQQKQINKLRQIIIEMQSELKMYKNSRLSTNCQSNKKRSKFAGYAAFSSSTSSIDIKSHADSNNSSPKDIRRLRQSDLKSQSLILSDVNKNSSNKKQRFNFGASQQSSESNKKETQKQKLDFIDKQPVVLSFVTQLKQRKMQNLPQITEQEGKDQFDNYVLIDS